MSLPLTLEELQKKSNELFFKLQEQSNGGNRLSKYELFSAIQEQCVPTIQKLLKEGAMITPKEAKMWLGIMIRNATSVSSTTQVLDIVLEASGCQPETLLSAAYDRRSIKIMNHLIVKMTNVSQDIWNLQSELTEWFKKSSQYQHGWEKNDKII
jgi:hypothetical protein